MEEEKVGDYTRDYINIEILFSSEYGFYDLGGILPRDTS